MEIPDVMPIYGDPFSLERLTGIYSFVIGRRGERTMLVQLAVVDKDQLIKCASSHKHISENVKLFEVLFSARHLKAF